VDTGLIMNRWILLVKYDEVKTKKQNYLVFHQKMPIRRNFPGAILPGLSFSCLPFLLYATPQCQTKLNPPEHLINISRTYGDTYLPIRIDRIAQPLGQNRKAPPSHALGGWGKIQ